jgi:hypothetical protein
MNETALMQTPQRRGNAGANTQKKTQLPGFPNEASKHSATVILDLQRQLSTLVNEL